MLKTFIFDYTYKTKTGKGRAQKTIRTDSEYAAVKELEKYHAQKGQEVISIHKTTVK